MIVLTGPLTGSMVCGSSKFVVVTKSPLTGGWCDSYSSGRTSIELKKAGYDGLVIRGKAAAPSYLKIGDRGAEIVSAAESGAGELRRRADAQGEGGQGRRRHLHRAGGGKPLPLRLHQQRQLPPGGPGRRRGRHGLQEPQGDCCPGERRRQVPRPRPGRRAEPEELRPGQKQPAVSGQVEVRHLPDAQRDQRRGILPTRNFQYGSWDQALGKLDSVGVYKSVKAHRSCQSCFVPLLAHDRGDRGAEQGGALRGAGIQRPSASSVPT